MYIEKKSLSPISINITSTLKCVIISFESLMPLINRTEMCAMFDKNRFITTNQRTMSDFPCSTIENILAFLVFLFKIHIRMARVSFHPLLLTLMFVLQSAHPLSPTYRSDRIIWTVVAILHDCFRPFAVSILLPFN